MQDLASELRKRPIPRTSVNKGKEGRGCYAPALGLMDSLAILWFLRSLHQLAFPLYRPDE
jgi:hypothetical protein